MCRDPIKKHFNLSGDLDNEWWPWNDFFGHDLRNIDGNIYIKTRSGRQYLIQRVRPNSELCECMKFDPELLSKIYTQATFEGSEENLDVGFTVNLNTGTKRMYYWSYKNVHIGTFKASDMTKICDSCKDYHMQKFIENNQEGDSPSYDVSVDPAIITEPSFPQLNLQFQSLSGENPRGILTVSPSRSLIEEPVLEQPFFPEPSVVPKTMSMVNPAPVVHSDCQNNQRDPTKSSQPAPTSWWFW